MMFFGWKSVGEARYDRGLFHWCPWVEQLEAFPESCEESTSTGTDGIVDNEGSVSALEERRKEL